MKALLAWALLSVSVFAAEPVYELNGHVRPEGPGAVSLSGATTPFRDSTFSDADGRFTFKKLQAGTYTVSVFFVARGEARQTVEVGPGTPTSVTASW